MNALEYPTGYLRILDLRFQWKIEKEDFVDKQVGELLISPVFYAVNAKWQMKLFPRGMDEDCQNYSSVVLTMLDCTRPVDTKIVIELFDINGFFKKMGSESRHYITGSIFLQRQYLPYEQLMERISTLKNFLLLCQFLPRFGTKILEPLSFIHSLNNTKYSDVKFIIGDQIIYAHKVILANKSDVFARMFDRAIQENLQNVDQIVVQDMEHEVLFELLRYIYVGAVNNIHNIAKSLLIAADSYNLVDLKEDCAKELGKQLEIDNVLEYLNLANRYGVDWLRTKVVGFIKSNANAIVQTPVFRSIMELHPEVVLDVVRFLSESRSVS